MFGDGAANEKQTNLNCQNNVVMNFSREEGCLLCGKIKLSMWEKQNAPHPHETPPRVETSELLLTIKHLRDLLFSFLLFLKKGKKPKDFVNRLIQTDLKRDNNATNPES